MGKKRNRGDSLPRPGVTDAEIVSPVSVSTTPSITTKKIPVPADILTPAPPKKSSPLASIFRSKPKVSSRSTDITITFAGDFANFTKTLAGALSHGAEGRFESIELSLAGTVFLPSTFNLTTVSSDLLTLKETFNMSGSQAAESFANVVNPMLVTIVDLASSSLGESDTSLAISALEVVLEFMSFAGNLYYELCGDFSIKPVVYEGALEKGKLEEMYGAYVSSTALAMVGGQTAGENAESAKGFGNKAERLQSAFGISDQKAEAVGQKVMMKSVMKLLKS